MQHSFPCSISTCLIFFFFNDTATTEIYTLSLHDALPIYGIGGIGGRCIFQQDNLNLAAIQQFERAAPVHPQFCIGERARSEEHTSELQSHLNLVCRLLLEKKKK